LQLRKPLRTFGRASNQEGGYYRKPKYPRIKSTTTTTPMM
jgi:hypothetical protein